MKIDGLTPRDYVMIEAGKVFGRIEAEQEREMEIIGHCFGLVASKNFSGGSNPVIQSREPRSQKRCEYLKNQAIEFIKNCLDILETKDALSK